MHAAGPKIAIIIARLGPYHVARVSALVKRFGAASVVVLEVARESREYAWEHVEGDGFVRRTLITDRDYQDVSAWELRRHMKAALEAENPDVVAINGWGFAEGRAAVAWCRRRNRVAVLMSDSQLRDSRRTWVREALKRAILRDVDAAFVGGKRHADYLARLGFDTARIALGYDSVDNAYFREGAAAARHSREQIRRQLLVPDRYFLASARFIPKKNLIRLLEAFGMYRRQVGLAAWDLVLLGDGPERPRLESARNALSLGTSVHMPGFRQYCELPAYYGLASAFIQPSTVEQWGLVVNEAMASGLPVLVSWACGAAELVHDGECGYRFDPESVADIARAMVQISREEGRLCDMGTAAAAAVERISPEAFADGLAAAVKVGQLHAAQRQASRAPTFAVWF